MTGLEWLDQKAREGKGTIVIDHDVDDGSIWIWQFDTDGDQRLAGRGPTVQEALNRIVGIEPGAEDLEPPQVDDTVMYCPECELPNQFGGLCSRCRDRLNEEYQS